MESTLYGETEEKYEKHILWEFFSFSGTKTLKRMNITPCGKRERTKMLKYMQNNLQKETEQHYEKKSNMSVFLAY